MSGKRIHLVWTFLLILLLGAGDVLAQAAPGFASAIEEGQEMVVQVMEENEIPGMSVAVAVDGRLAWSEGFGFANLEHEVPVTRETRFRIGSVSKPVTAAAMAVLYEEGKLDLDAPVQRYVPSFPEKRWPITSRQVAGHLAGIRHYQGLEFMSSRRYRTVLSGLSIFESDTLLFEPETNYNYSTYGWNLLSAVVEGAADQEFLSYMQDAVFGPLGMTSIIAEHTDSLIAHRASFYVFSNDGQTLNAPYVDNSYKWAGGGFIANTEDLVRFGSAHLDGSFLEPATVQLFFATQQKRDGEATNYGIGWRSGTDNQGRYWVGHSGGSMGGRAMLLVYPEEKVVVAMLANSGSAPMSPALAQRLAAPFLQGM